MIPPFCCTCLWLCLFMLAWDCKLCFLGLPSLCAPSGTLRGDRIDFWLEFEFLLELDLLLLFCWRVLVGDDEAAPEPSLLKLPLFCMFKIEIRLPMAAGGWLPPARWPALSAVGLREPSALLDKTVAARSLGIYDSLRLSVESSMRWMERCERFSPSASTSSILFGFPGTN